MVYAPIAKLDNFTGEEDDAQVWLNDVEKAITANRWNDARAMQVIPYFLKDTTNSWYQSLINKPQDFNAFKAEFLKYFNNNNSINCLVNAFTIIKQRETEAVTTYLGHFYRNLHQIQAINANYFTALQILNQFIHGLYSSILQHVHPLHPGIFQDAVTCTRDFESAESETNHAQAVNLVMNGSSKLDSKLKNLHNDAIIKETLIVPKINHWQQETRICHYCDNQEHIQIDCHQHLNNQQSGNQYQNPDRRFQTPNHYPNQNQDQYQNNYLSMTQQPIYQPPVYQPPIYQLQPQVIYQPQPQIIYQPQPIQTPLQNSAQMTSDNPQSRVTQNWRSVMVVHQLIPHSLDLPSRSRTQNLDTNHVQNPNSQHYLSLLITPEDATSNNTESNQYVPTNTIPPATISSDKFLAAIFPFKLEENTPILLFSGAIFEEKPITAMYTDARVDDHRVNRAASTRIITADGATKTPISKIDDFPIEINGIIVPIKVLVMDTTQYQALVGNDWLSKTNAMFNWTTQELILSQNGRHTQVPAMCGHFKTTSTTAPLINFDEEKPKPTWEAYQVLWTDEKHNELPPILSWDNNNKEKGKQKEKLT
ncbi:hypothetical protein G9A89_023618 [Geosiphon pyriformis]|nr:hypothetical protein G9A89_023618 [Geosiphon pyriformis]